MTINEWKECLSLYKPFFYDWCRAEGIDLGEQDLSQFWEIFKQWFYEVRTDGKGRRISLKEAERRAGL